MAAAARTSAQARQQKLSFQPQLAKNIGVPFPEQNMGRQWVKLLKNSSSETAYFIPYCYWTCWLGGFVVMFFWLLIIIYGYGMGLGYFLLKLSVINKYSIYITGTHQMETKDEDALICQQKVLQAKLIQVAADISSIAICSPMVVNFFANCPQIFVKSAVTIWKLNQYVSMSKHLLNTDADALRDIFVVYRRKLIFYNPQAEEADMLVQDMEYFGEALSNYFVIPPQLSNQFISLQLAANRVGYDLYSNFPEYLLSFGQINFDILCNCLRQFATRPQNYNFTSIKQRLTKMIQQQFQKFLDRPNISQTSNEVQALKFLILRITTIYKSNEQNCFRAWILDDLVGKTSFGCVLFAVFRKVGCLKLFRDWVEVVISLGRAHQAMDLMEFALFYYTSLSLQLQVVQLIEENVDWAKQWIHSLMTNKFLMLSATFLNGVPYYFIILNKLLMLYNFKDEQDFNTKLDQLGYEGAARTLPHDDQTKLSMLEMLKYFVEDYEELYHLLLKDQ